MSTNQVPSSIPTLCEALTLADLSPPDNSKSNHPCGNCSQWIEMNLKVVIAKHRQALIKARFVMHQQWLLNWGTLVFQIALQTSSLWTWTDKNYSGSHWKAASNSGSRLQVITFKQSNRLLCSQTETVKLRISLIHIWNQDINLTSYFKQADLTQDESVLLQFIWRCPNRSSHTAWGNTICFYCCEKENVPCVFTALEHVNCPSV